MKYRKFVIAGDSHGDQLDETCAMSFFGFMEDWKPELRIHSGDAFDFRNLRKGATDDEKAASLKDDWSAGKDFLKRFFKGKGENHFIRGNHDERLWRFRESCSGLLRDYADEGIDKIEKLAKSCRAKMMPYDSRYGVLDIGKLRVVHGYATGIGAANKHARVYGNCFYGHTHDMSVAPVENIGGPAEARGDRLPMQNRHALQCPPNQQTPTPKRLGLWPAFR